MKSSVIIFPGSNCDQDVANSLYSVLSKKPSLIWYKNTIPKNTDLIVLPGGFSFGDYLRSGAIASSSRIIKDIKSFANKGVPIIGICNGFQILTEANLLPGTLIINKNLKFICKETHLKVINKTSIFSKGLDANIIKLPIAHKMGNYTISENELKQIRENDQIVFQYCSVNGVVNDNFNPNGSINNIAGVLSKNKKILGLMPHPERFTDINKKDKIMKKICKFL